METPKIILDSEHNYWVDGQRFDGVTEVLRAEGFMGMFIPSDLDFYLARGTMIHRATELYDLSTLDESTVDPQIVGYLESWKKYREHTGIAYQPDEIERQLSDPVWRFAGSPDRLDCDIKSGGPEKWHIFQVAAYNYLARVNLLPHGPNKTVYLQEDGSMPKVIPYSAIELKAALDTFLCALRVHRVKREMGI